MAPSPGEPTNHTPKVQRETRWERESKQSNSFIFFLNFLLLKVLDKSPFFPIDFSPAKAIANVTVGNEGFN